MMAYYGGRWLLMRELQRQQNQAQFLAEHMMRAIVTAQQKRDEASYTEQQWNEAFEQHGDGTEWIDPQLELWAEEDLEELQHKKSNT